MSEDNEKRFKELLLRDEVKGQPPTKRYMDLTMMSVKTIQEIKDYDESLEKGIPIYILKLERRLSEIEGDIKLLSNSFGIIARELQPQVVMADKG